MKSIITAILLTMSVSANAAFTYKATHPANFPIDELETYEGGVYVGNNQQPFDIYRYDPAFNRMTLEHTMQSQGIKRMRKLNGRLYFLGWRSIGGSNANDLLTSRDPRGTIRTLQQQDFGKDGGVQWLNFEDINTDESGDLHIVGYGQSFAFRVSHEWKIDANNVNYRPSAGPIPFVKRTPYNESGCLIFKGYRDWATLSGANGLFSQRSDGHCEPIALNSHSLLWLNNPAPGAPRLHSVRDVLPMPNWLILHQGRFLFRAYRYPQAGFTGFRWNQNTVYDFTIDNGELFVLKENGQVCRTRDPLQPLDCFDQAPSSARQIAVDRSGVYVGTNTSEIWSAPNPSSTLVNQTVHTRMP